MNNTQQHPWRAVLVWLISLVMIIVLWQLVIWVSGLPQYVIP